MYDIWIICYGILTIVFICVGYFAKDKDQINSALRKKKYKQDLLKVLQSIA